MPINDDLHHILLRRKAEAQGKTGRLAHARVFSHPDGSPWSKWCVENHFKKALAAADIQKPLIFDDLRHTSASRMKRNGIGETEIQRVLGHKTLAMTDRSITVEIEQMRTAVASLASKNNAKETAPVLTVAGNHTN